MGLEGLRLCVRTGALWMFSQAMNELDADAILTPDSLQKTRVVYSNSLLRPSYSIVIPSFDTLEKFEVAMTSLYGHE